VIAAFESWQVILAIVVVLAAVQSVFGVGLLVFGTPLLLLMDLQFPTVLAYLLPCSLTISAMQVVSSGGLTLETIRRQFLVFTAPAVLVTTAATLYYGSPEQIGLAVGIMLLVTALLRFLGPGHRAVSSLVTRYRRSLLTGLGVVHGLSNLGGGVLTAIVGSTFEDKESIRRHIAFCYGLMAGLQFTVVLLDGPVVMPVLWLTLPIAAAVVYLIVGQWLFLKATRAGYQHALTTLLMAFGILLVTR
jgi:hypothetical protein